MSSTSTIAFLSVPSPYQPYSVSQRSYNGQTLSFTRSSLIINHIPLSSSSSSASSSVVVEEEEEEEEEEESPSPSPDGLATQDPDNAFPPTRGCKVCGRDVLEKGCNGEGRIQGGIATVPGFGWWPIKAYRPCPGFVASGGRYRRRGQSMDEVAFGRGEKD